MRIMSGIDAILQAAVGGGDVAGVVALAADADRVRYEGAFGKRSLAGTATMTTDTVFWIASMTKTFTSVAALQLVERGKLDLDTPAGSIVAGLAAPVVLVGFDESGAPVTRAAARPITVRHLLTHTAGFGYDMWSAELVRYQEREGLPRIATCRNAALETPLLFDPGDRWQYGINVDWLGKIVEAISGMDLQAYLRANIFGPLGLASTSFTLSPAQRSRLAGMHKRLPDGSLQAIPFEVPQHPEFFTGGGGLYSTPGDFLTFARMLLREGTLDGTRILRAETVRLMFRNQIGATDVVTLKTALPAITNDVDFFGTGQKWGFGVLVHTSPGPAGRGVGSVTWAGLGNTYYWLDPAARLCAVFFTQQFPFADAAVLQHYHDFEHGLYESLRSIGAAS